MSTTAADRARAPADPVAPAAANEEPQPFQFRIRDVLIVTTLAALFVGGVSQQNPWLIIGFAIASFASLMLVWGVSWGHGAMGLIVLTAASCMLMPQDEGRVAARRIQCGNQIHSIGLALANYHDIHDTFPPAYIADASGKPIHSWRVLILPYMEQQTLFDQYRFDEPWDGPNNRLLAPKIKRVYSCPSNGTKPPTDTSYVAVIGPGTPWPEEQALTYQDFPDGTAHVVHVVEVHNSGIHWMEPRDLHLTQMAATINPPQGQGISSAHPNGAQVVFVDGHVTFLKADTPPAVIRSLIHRDDGTLPLPD
jgi:prepilin-type processing-associated H-X9-DG protein